MQFTQDNAAGKIIQSYTPGCLIVSGVEYSDNLIIQPGSCESWSISDHSEINYESLRPVFLKNPEVIIVGTGIHQHFPPANVYLPMLQTGIGIEIMDSAAASRTYNVLIAEERNVIAAIIV